MATRSSYIQERVMKVICEALGPNAGKLKIDDRLEEFGLDSLKSINLLLAMEAEFGIVFPDESLTIDTFSSPINICQVVQKIVEQV